MNSQTIENQEDMAMHQIQLLTMSSPRNSFILYIDENGKVSFIQKSTRFPFPFELGQHIDDPGLKITNTAKAWHNHEYLEAEGNPKNFGFNYVTKTMPLKHNDGTFAGVITIIYPSNNSKILEQGVSNLSNQVGVINQLGEEMLRAATDKAASNEGLIKRVIELQSHAKTLSEINTIVVEVANQTNLLGINAAIEAARVGDEGKGFSLVANEIRRLSITVKESSKQVNEKINEIFNDIGIIHHSVQVSSIGNEEMTTQLHELFDSIDQVHKTSISLFS